MFCCIFRLTCGDGEAMTENLRHGERSEEKMQSGADGERIAALLTEKRDRLVKRLADLATAEDAAILDGQWIPRSSVRKNFLRLRLRGWLVLLELLGVFLGLLIVAFLIFAMLVAFMGPPW